MVNVQSPLVGLQYDDTTARYIGVLESTLSFYVVRDAQFRALLELLTGEQWDDVKLDLDGKELMRISEETLVRKTGMTPIQARTLVAKHWNKLNQEVVVVPEAADLTGVAPLDAKNMFEQWKNRKQSR